MCAWSSYSPPSFPHVSPLASRARPIPRLVSAWLSGCIITHRTALACLARLPPVHHGGAGGKSWETGSGRYCRPSCPVPRSSRCDSCGGACVWHEFATAVRGAGGSVCADCVAGHAGQVGSDGAVRVVSGAEGEGTSLMTLSGGKGLGTDSAQRLADLLHKAPPPLLASLDIR
jgi:hypothetical protein